MHSGSISEAREDTQQQHFEKSAKVKEERKNEDKLNWWEDISASTNYNCIIINLFLCIVQKTLLWQW